MDTHLTVKQLMTTRVISVDMDCTVAAIGKVFENQRFHHVVVVDKGCVVGVISDRDFLAAVSPFVGTASERACDEYTLEKRAHQIMSRRPFTCDPSTLVPDAARCMLENQISCLPVLDEHGVCVGMITVRDITRWVMETFGIAPKGDVEGIAA